MTYFKNKIKDKGLKIIWLADKCGISQPLMSMYLNGDRPMPSQVEDKLKELLN